jgi:hypothetical protein
MFQQLEFSVGSLAQDCRAEWLHDLLYRHGGACELIFGGTEKN